MCELLSLGVICINYTRRIKMISKLFLVLFVLIRLTFISSEEEFFRMPKLKTIQDEIFAKMASYTQVPWNQTAHDRQNFHIFPILIKIRHYMTLMKLFHGISYFFSETFMARPYGLARILDKMQNTSDVDLKFPSAIFYDRRQTSWLFLEDLKNYYHTETYEISFEPSNEQSLTTMINNWMYRVTGGREQPKNGSYRLISMDNYQSTVLSFTGCWESTKTRVITYETSERRKRFIPAIPVFAKLKFEIIKEEIEVHSFSAKDTIGYYKDTRKKFEAIRIPFKNEEFAMVVMLPYYNQSLEIFNRFTAADYRTLLQRVDEYYEIVDYTIPVINSTKFLINENGVSINGGDLCNYTEVREPTKKKDFHHRSFIVDRPFGIIIYHEPTLFVFMYALVRNPLDKWPTPKFNLLINTHGEDEDIQHTS